MLFPAWLASMTHEPAVLKVTVPDDIEQTVLEDESTVIVTGKPELAVAVGVYVLPTVALAGAVLVNVIV